MAKNRMSVYVSGQHFTLITDEPENYVYDIINKTESKIKGVSANYPKLNLTSCAVLAALDYCDDKAKLKEELLNLRGQVKDYLLENENLRQSIQSLKEENAKIKSDFDKLLGSIKIEPELVPDIRNAAKKTVKKPRTKLTEERQESNQLNKISKEESPHADGCQFAEGQRNIS